MRGEVDFLRTISSEIYQVYEFLFYYKSLATEQIPIILDNSHQHKIAQGKKITGLIFHRLSKIGENKNEDQPSSRYLLT